MTTRTVLRRLCTPFLLCSSLALPLSAAADLIKVSYSGVLTEVSGAKLADFFGAANVPVVGATFSGGFIFNLSTPDTNAAANIGLYTGGNSQFFVNFGALGGSHVQNPALPYNQGEVGNDVPFGALNYDVWTAYGQLDNNKGYEYVETGMVLLSLLLDSIGSDAFPLPGQIDPSKFTVAGGCDPGGAGAAAGIFCSRDMEFHAKQDRGGDPYNIYGDADIYGFITEFGMERMPDPVPEPASLALVVVALTGAGALRRRHTAQAAAA